MVNRILLFATVACLIAGLWNGWFLLAAAVLTCSASALNSVPTKPKE